MAYFIPKPVVLEVYRWFKNGDAPGDGVINGINSGAIVGRHPSRGGHAGCMLCSHCGKAMGDHGKLMYPTHGSFTNMCPGDWLQIIRDDKKRITGYVRMTNKELEQYYIPLPKDIIIVPTKGTKQ
jgi:hypothetical protein